MPFYELFLACDFGDINGKTFSETMISVFEEGYDVRFGATMAIPVVMNELMIKVIWMVRQKFIRKKTWKESVPTNKHADLRIMLIVGDATLCMVDGVDAAAHGIIEGNVISFVCHLNLVGWTRLIMLVLRELRIRYGAVVLQAIDQFVNKVLEEIQAPAEKRRIWEFYSRLEYYDQHLSELLAEFVAQVEKEYYELCFAIDATFDDNSTSQERAESSVRLAQISGVSDDKIVKSRKELDDLFG